MRPPKRDFEIIDPKMAEFLRRLSPVERFSISLRLNRSVRQMLTAHLEREYPGWTTDDVRREVARRISRGAA